MFNELLQLAIRNLLRARGRLAMTSGGVLVGTTAVIMLIALTNGLQRAAEMGIGSSGDLTRINVGEMYVYNPDGSPGPEFPKLDHDAVAAFEQIEGVQAVVAMVGLRGGMLITPDGLTGYTSFTGIEPENLQYMNLTMAQGVGEFQAGQRQVIGSFDINNYFADPTAETWEPIQYDIFNNPVSLQLQSFDETREINLNVVGIQGEGRESYRSYMPLQDVLDYNEFMQPPPPEGEEPQPFRFDEILVIAESREYSSSIASAIKELDFMVYGPVELLEQINGFFGTMRLALGGVGAIALLVSAFGVANTMMMAILERTREIGLMKAVGATNQDVLTVFLIESGLVGLVGGLAGGVVSVLLQNGINGFLRSLAANAGEQQGGGGMMFMPVDLSQMNGELIVIDPVLLLLAVGVATGVGIAAGLYPAWRAAVQLEPVTALKAE